MIEYLVAVDVASVAGGIVVIRRIIDAGRVWQLLGRLEIAREHEAIKREIVR